MAAASHTQDTSNADTVKRYQLDSLCTAAVTRTSLVRTGRNLGPSTGQEGQPEESRKHDWLKDTATQVQIYDYNLRAEKQGSVIG